MKKYDVNLKDICPLRVINNFFIMTLIILDLIINIRIEKRGREIIEDVWIVLALIIMKIQVVLLDLN